MYTHFAYSIHEFKICVSLNLKRFIYPSTFLNVSSCYDIRSSRCSNIVLSCGEVKKIFTRPSPTKQARLATARISIEPELEFLQSAQIVVEMIWKHGVHFPSIYEGESIAAVADDNWIRLRSLHGVTRSSEGCNVTQLICYNGYIKSCILYSHNN